MTTRIPRVNGLRIGTAAAVLVVAIVALVARFGRTEDVPQTFTYQGRLLGTTGVPVPDGSRDVRLRFFDVASAGTPLCEWTEPDVPFVSGRFAVTLGDDTGSGPCPDVQAVIRLHRDIWVELAVEVAGGGIEPLSPRLPLGSAPRAQHVEYAETSSSEVVGQLVPEGMILAFESDCPTGWERVVELDGRFPVGGTEWGTLVGSETTGSGGTSHTHPTSTDGSHTHGVAVAGAHSHGLQCCVPWGDALIAYGWVIGTPGCCERPAGYAGVGDHGHGMDAAGSHAHTLNATDWSHTHAIMPPYRDVVFCAKLPGGAPGADADADADAGGTTDADADADASGTGEDCSSCLTISAPGTYTGNTCSFGNDYTATCGGSAASDDVVYRLDLASARTVTFDLCGSSYDTVVFVRSGDCATGAQVGCNDDDSRCSGYQSYLSLSLAAGTYYVFVDGYSSGNCGDYSMTVSY